MLAISDRHVSLAEAHAWIDAHMPRAGSETVALQAAAGRVLAAAWASPADRPPADCAAWDGYAVRAADTEGAGDYSPILLSPAAAPLLRAGEALPPGADAVLALDTISCAGDMREATAPAAQGRGVERRGSELAAGEAMLAAGHRLRPQDLALLAGFGVVQVDVALRPRIGLRVGAALAPMLRALVVRDGGVPEARAGVPAELILAAQDDAEAAAVCVVALRPGERAGCGMSAGVPAVLLPTLPAGCLAGYELLAGRAVRRCAGLPAGLPHPVSEAVLERKIVSALGVTDLVQVRLAAGRAMPLGAADAAGLVAAVRADGFVVVPAASEGLPPGSAVRVHRYDAQGQA